MFKAKDEVQLYFSTKAELTISGVRYRPSICYKVPMLAKASLQANKKVTIYDAPVRFVNGKVVSAKVDHAVPVASIKRTVENSSVKKRKK